MGATQLRVAVLQQRQAAQQQPGATWGAPFTPQQQQQPSAPRTWPEVGVAEELLAQQLELVCR